MQQAEIKRKAWDQSTSEIKISCYAESKAYIFPVIYNIQNYLNKTRFLGLQLWLDSKFILTSSLVLHLWKSSGFKIFLFLDKCHFCQGQYSPVHQRRVPGAPLQRSGRAGRGGSGFTKFSFGFQEL